MQEQDTAPGYYIWGIDHSVYGPIELPTLVKWIKGERVIANTWLFVERDHAWSAASEIPELKMFFRPKGSVGADGPESPISAKINPGALRRIKALADMTDEQLSIFLTFIDIVEVRPFTHLVRKGDSGEAMYGVLEGELRSCILVDGKECPVATLGPGAIFGEISLFDRGPHAADVIANQESVLMKLTAAAVAKLSKEAPDAAFAMLLGLVKAIAGRVRVLTKRYEDSVQGAHRTEALQVA